MSRRQIIRGPLSRHTGALMAAGALILAVQAIASYTLRREPFLPYAPPLVLFPTRLGNWLQVSDGVLDPEVLQMLAPDDALSRQYRLEDGSQQADLFVAYYKTQLRANLAHDPKVCLPGAGWNPRVSRAIDVSVPELARTFPVNYYRIAKENNEAVVLYWFQTYKGVYMFEQQLRFNRVLDTILDNRTDMALVRIVAPVRENGVARADSSAMQVAQFVYKYMLPYFPSKEKS